MKAAPKTRNGIDIVISYYMEDLSALSSLISLILSQPSVSSRSPRVILYSKGHHPTPHLLNTTSAHAVHPLPNRGREGATFLSHVVRNYKGELARWTAFMQAEPMPAEAVVGMLADHLREDSGFLTLRCWTPCECWGCYGPFTRVAEVWALTKGEVCPEEGYAQCVTSQ
ncbi:hypothetical protein HK101_005601 [Irineochytrium annulatum]|nr:hypothetical protein HK101_005601 [Irineochytrium annulatum]